jgi:hypothetical protein
MIVLNLDIEQDRDPDRPYDKPIILKGARSSTIIINSGRSLILTSE